jgi:hypothetical protein
LTVSVLTPTRAREAAPLGARPVALETRPAGGRDAGLLARRALRAQIARLERRLAAVSPELVTGARGRTGPELLSLGELELVRDDLVARLSGAAQAAAAQAAAQAAARANLESMLAHPAAHRWERVTRAQLGEPGCGAYHVRPRLGLLGLLMDWWCVKLSSGCPLCGASWAL